MSEPERRSSVACWRRPSEIGVFFSGVGGRAGFEAHFWGRRRGDVLLGWCWGLAGYPTWRMEDSGEGSGAGLGD